MRIRRAGRHRLGMAGGVHCLTIPAVAAAFAEHRRPWPTSLRQPARHSLAARRRRTPAPATTRWVPATAS
ncbi:hypothetical protein IU449_25615 [Nocardia higoensis]|uniref:Uncharacterized protein n=1 Tax=Nocardia higoensis TaxID=228599 RepID=A0ABS0DHE0_9NOCA|nr:hypothetical protein [Nocardia higoensis]MBF6357880.1 hypothetical protein [Nocardia higoensis]